MFNNVCTEKCSEQGVKKLGVLGKECEYLKLGQAISYQIYQDTFIVQNLMYTTCTKFVL